MSPDTCKLFPQGTDLICPMGPGREQETMPSLLSRCVCLDVCCMFLWMWAAFVYSGVLYLFFLYIL